MKGRQVYDARLAALMIESGIDHILTFNVDEFRRFPGITAVNPHSLAAPAQPPEQGSTTAEASCHASRALCISEAHSVWPNVSMGPRKGWISRVRRYYPV